MLPFRYRFHGHGSLRYVYKNGASERSRLMTIKFSANPRRKHPRFSVVVSKKVLKSAVGRNKIRRRTYEALSEVGARSIAPYDIVIIITSPEVKTIEYSELTTLLRDFISSNHLLD